LQFVIWDWSDDCHFKAANMLHSMGGVIQPHKTSRQTVPSKQKAVEENSPAAGKIAMVTDYHVINLKRQE